MKVVVVGAGAVGFQLARQLTDEKRDVVLIEKDSETAAHVVNTLDCMVITGEGTSLDVLRRAGTDDADVFVAATDSDEVNMIACGMVSAEFSVPTKIARVRNIDYHTARISGQSFLGIDYIVNPEYESAQAIIRAIEHGAVSDIMLFEQSRMQIRNVAVDSGSPLVGRTLEQISMDLPGSFLVAVIVRENRYLIPSGSTTVAVGDILYVVATHTDFDEIFERLGKQKSELKKVTIVGGGKIGRLLIEYLLAPRVPAQGIIRRLIRTFAPAAKRHVKVVEKDPERCKELTRLFPQALVVKGDVSDDAVFEEEHFANSDLLIVATDNQELNIVTALYAKSQGVKRAIVLVNRSGYAEVASQLGIDVPVSRKNALVTSILKYIRAQHVRSVHSISDGKIEAIEITVDGTSRAVGRPIRDLSLPKDTLIVALERDGMNLIPDGAQVLRAADHLVLIARKEHSERVQEIFAS